MTRIDDPGAFGGKELLAVFAHPDDESLAAGGLLSWCAALGARVTLLCATRGENGAPDTQRTDAPQTREAQETLGTIRERELRAAARALGAHDVLLLRHEDGMLPWVDPETLETELVEVVRVRRPDVVVTFDADGLYWHPDHIAIHERTTSAIATITGVGPESNTQDRTGDVAERADPALYYVTMPPGAMRDVMNHATDQATGHATQREALPVTAMHILGVSDPDAFGSEAAAPTLIVDAGRYAEHKLRALRCHRSQMSGCALEAVSERDAPRLLGLEHYRRAPIWGPARPFIEHLRRPADARTRVEHP